MFIFEMFVKLHKKKRKKVEGLNIGFYFEKKIFCQL